MTLFIVTQSQYIIGAHQDFKSRLKGEASQFNFISFSLTGPAGSDGGSSRAGSFRCAHHVLLPGRGRPSGGGADVLGLRSLRDGGRHLPAALARPRPGQPHPALTSTLSLTTVKAQSVHKYYLSAATAAAPTCGLRCGAEGGSWECFTLRPLPVQGLLFLQFIFKSFLIKSFNLKSNYLTTTTSQATGFCF